MVHGSTGGSIACLGAARPRGQEVRLTGRDAVAVKARLVGDLLAPALGLLDRLLVLLCRPEAPTALLIHLGPRCNAVDGEEEELLGLDDAEEVGDVAKDGEEDVLLADAERRVVVVGVRAVVDDAVHVQV